MDKISRRRGRVGKKFNTQYFAAIDHLHIVVCSEEKKRQKYLHICRIQQIHFPSMLQKNGCKLLKCFLFLDGKWGIGSTFLKTRKEQYTSTCAFIQMQYVSTGDPRSSHVLNYIFEVYQALDASRRKVMSKVARNCITGKSPKRQRNATGFQKGNVYSSLEIETNYLFLGESLLKRLKIKTFSVLLGSSHLLGQCYSTLDNSIQHFSK